MRIFHNNNSCLITDCDLTEQSKNALDSISITLGVAFDYLKLDPLIHLLNVLNIEYQLVFKTESEFYWEIMTYPIASLITGKDKAFYYENI